MAYDITHAKSSELAHEAYNHDPKAEISEEEKEFKRKVKERRNQIKSVMKR